jgi:hypothetical protein
MSPTPQDRRALVIHQSGLQITAVGNERVPGSRVVGESRVNLCRDAEPAEDAGKIVRPPTVTQSKGHQYRLRVASARQAFGIAQ